MQLWLIGQAPPHRTKASACQGAYLSRSAFIQTGLLQRDCCIAGVDWGQLDVCSGSANYRYDQVMMR